MTFLADQSFYFQYLLIEWAQEVVLVLNGLKLFKTFFMTQTKAITPCTWAALLTRTNVKMVI